MMNSLVKCKSAILAQEKAKKSEDQEVLNIVSKFFKIMAQYWMSFKGERVKNQFLHTPNFNQPPVMQDSAPSPCTRT